eukprot:CAMPEP_0204180082 /NCGR_PEP_ID=MMETSP0361-20130328/50689_1 /ASSEMBLY_ACC=CAM_ASM_000343 /TAXON_ID=268821 /ORGANISM="Scrippsiella Hangoei, Strain SHTV-5" /LENGTH=999 /DNA_ID=CAMNT_0051139447 /DNA_START=12 /DNA_END=3011 /DNA_ORIENTATION=+
MKSLGARAPLLLLGAVLAAEPWFATAASVRLSLVKRSSTISEADAAPIQEGTQKSSPVDALRSEAKKDLAVSVELKAREAAKLALKHAVLDHTIMLQIEQISEQISTSFRGRIRSNWPDWTVTPLQYSIQLWVPLLAIILAALMHKPDLAKNRRSGRLSEEEGGPSEAKTSSSVIPALFLVSMVAVFPSDHAPWISAQVPLLFMVLGYGVGCMNPPRPLFLVAAAVLSYILCLCWCLSAGKASPEHAAWTVMEGLVPVEALSSLPLSGVPQVSACFGAALACLALSSGLVRLCRGAGCSGLFYLWLLALLGVCVDMDCFTTSKFIDPIVASLPSRLQLPSFAAGMIVSSWAAPESRSNRVLGLAVAVAYSMCWQLPVSDAAWHAVYRGAILPLHALLLWCTMDYLTVLTIGPAVLDTPGAASGTSAKTPTLPVSFAVLFALPMLAARPDASGVAQGRGLLLMLCAACHCVEWTVWLALQARSGAPLADKELGARDTFLGSFTDETAGVRNSLPFRLLQAGSYYAFFLGGAFFGLQHYDEMMHRPPTECVFAHPMFDNMIRTLGWSTSIVSGGVVLWNLLGMLMFAPTWRSRTPPAMEMQSSAHGDLVLCFRYCTRGTNPSLVSDNVEKMHAILEESGLKKGTWRLEVVTDSPLGLSALCAKGLDVTETLVPSSYKCPNGGKFKARAMHWAIRNSETKLRLNDWICHLDEETYFDIHTVCAVYQHCQKQNVLVASGEKVFPDMGQGTIMYNTFGLQPDKLLTALADTGRVGDDLGKFRFQYTVLGRAAIGMHGSFAVMSQAVEEAIGFDLGPEGSICEDSYFAMRARQDIGLGASWIDAWMYEQSPFSIMDLIRQRGRWFHGLFFCTSFGGQGFSFSVSWILSLMMSTWILCFGIFAVNVLVRIHGMTSCTPDYLLLFWADTISMFFKMIYMLGFANTFSPYLEGWPAWLSLFYMQTTLLPVLIGIIEMSGVAHGVYLLFLRESVFYVVQKEKKIHKIVG